MPLFYFDVRRKTSFEVDHKGRECADINAASIVAERRAANVLVRGIDFSEERPVTVEVRNEYSQRALTVEAKLATFFVWPQPEPPAPKRAKRRKRTKAAS
ncbi:F-actin-capping protein subunit alpha [Afifella sp. IM 167]|uniref:F-actin-capping protein subunit alpha n=1 Tax=Afifella sp. IM 167 TaxID=2033586 RepID=UPI001CCCFE70|nr:F-actin-capping protein subunit alpha [Afifella sp. IM 167]MBZ8134391.1 hypothetical protein [Afifella sp. IM 167]